MRYRTTTKYNFYLSLLFVLASVSIAFSQDTFLDNFNPANYSGNDGSQNFNGNWIETNDDGSPNGNGRIYINTTQQSFNANWLLFINLDGRSIRRAIDLSSYSTVTLSIDYDARFRGNESLVVQLFNNTTSAYETVSTINSGVIGVVNYTLTAAQISSASAIRFIGGDNNWNGNEGIFVDNVLFTGSLSTPEIAIDDVTVDENAGNAVFTVTHSGGDVPGGFTVNYSTANGTATAGQDYNAVGAGSINFSGTTPRTQTISIPIIDNTFVETLSETFVVNLTSVSSPSVTIADNQGQGTITDDDPASISINDVTVDEPDGTITFTVTLTGGNVPGGFTVDYATAPTPTNPANDPADYIGTGAPVPSLNFSGNGTSNEQQTITLTIVDDGTVEGDETFFVNLSNISNSLVTISNGQGLGTINDDEAPIEITNGSINTCSDIFQDSNANPGNPGNYDNNENFTYTICPDVAGNFVVADFTFFDVETRNSTTLFWDVLRIYDGNNTSAPLIGNFDNFNVPGTITSTNTGCLTFNFTSDGSVTMQGWEATISCINFDLTIDNPTVNEAAGSMDFTITYSGSATSPFTIDYATAPDTALELSDFTPTSGTLNFNGTTNQSLIVTVPIIDNNYLEPDETFFLNLSNISDVSINFTPIGTGTITDDADPPIPNEVPLTLFDEFNGYYDYALTAGSFRTADNATDPCSIATTSSNTLTTTIPAGSTIERAYLTWAHSGAAPDEIVTFEGQMVVAETIYSANQLAQFYSMKSDVTSIIQGLADPSTEIYDLTDLNITNSGSYCGTTVLGGWSLMIFYTNPTLPAVSINFYDGFNSEQNSSSSYTLDGFFAIGSSGSKTSVLSWEGDVDFTGGETITLTTGAGITTLNGDGDNTGGTQNVFNSTIYDDTTIPIINDSSQYGVDLDTYDISPLISLGETSATTNVNVGGDIVLLNSVLLKVPSNLITGRVFEDINYGGGAGRDFVTSGSLGIDNVRVELYDSAGNFEEFDITDANGDYNIGGMANGNYSLRVSNTTIRSNRDDVPVCNSCIPVQTYRVGYNGGDVFDFVTDEVGGADPAGQDTPSGSSINPQLIGAQTISPMTILNEGVIDIDFGFTYNAVVNTNAIGQGSLNRFIINANQLNSDYNGGTLINIEANSIFDPAAGEEVCIFMIPPTGDPLGRTADANYNANGYFDIDLPNTILDNMGIPQPFNLQPIFGENIHIDGRTQTAYMGDRNTGTIGAGGRAVGTAGVILPNYELPEIQIHQNDGDVINSSGSNAIIRNLAIFADNNAGIFSIQGSPTITQNLIGVNALGIASGNIDRGINLRGTVVANIDGNYIAENTDRGIYIEGTTTTQIQNNHITKNGNGSCFDNIRIVQGSDVTITNNLIEDADAVGIDAQNATGTLIITGNTIRNSGQNGGACGTIIENMGIKTTGNNATITNNIVNNNGGAGIVLGGGTTSGNLISQNSIYANGTAADALGIDIDSAAGNVDGNGVTINDNGDGDGGPNGSLNFPVFETATIKGTTLKISGWSPPGATIELFLTDIAQGTANLGDNQLGRSIDYGEGQVYLTTVTEGSGADTDGSTSSYTSDGFTETTNRFSFEISLVTTIPRAGNYITSTATVSNSTSEFSGSIVLGIPNVITNRRITYRVTPAIASITGGVTGTLTNEITADNFQDGNNGAPFSIIFRNTTASAIANYEILVKNVPYASIPGLALGSHTITTTNNGNGTYSHLFTSTAALGASETRTINGGIPAPAGTGTSCGCITFYEF